MFGFIGRCIDNLIYKMLRKHPLVESAFTNYGVSTDDSVRFQNNPVLAGALRKQFKFLINDKIFLVTEVDQERQTLTISDLGSPCCFEVEQAFFLEYMVPVDKDVKNDKTA